MRIEKDFRDFIALLNKNEVHYVIIGGYAFSFYAEPRFTKDIDILIEASKENAKKNSGMHERFRVLRLGFN